MRQPRAATEEPGPIFAGLWDVVVRSGKIAEDHIDGDVGVIIVQLLLKYRMSGPAKMAKASKIHALRVEWIAILSTIGGIRSARKNHWVSARNISWVRRGRSYLQGAMPN